MKITIGADPEIFVHDRRKNHYISAHDLIPGTKKNPYGIKYGAVQVDGVALEYNIEPASSPAQFTAYNMAVLRTLNHMVQQKNNAYSLIFKPTIHFPVEYFEKEIPADAKVLGCDPDYNAYTGEINHPPSTKKPMRTGSGHIHIGWTENADPLSPAHFFDCISVVKQLDHTLGFLSSVWDEDTERQELYGKMGTFRPKPYGVEYRVLSNAWLRYPRLYPWIFNTVKTSLADLERGRRYAELANLPFDSIRFPEEFPMDLTKHTHDKANYNEIRKNLNILYDINFKPALLNQEISFA